MSYQNNEIKPKVSLSDNVKKREDKSYLCGLLEAILLVSKKPISLPQLAKICKLSITLTRELLDDLIDDYNERDAGILLREVDGYYHFVSNLKYSAQIQKALNIQRKKALSSGALETLAIICYRQPVTLAEIDELRGVNSKGILYTLMEKKLIQAHGFKNVPGKPTTYVTTRQFLEIFALSSLKELPELPSIH